MGFNGFWSENGAGANLVERKYGVKKEVKYQI